MVAGFQVSINGRIWVSTEEHDAATGGRRFNALLATASINDAIDYYDIFENTQKEMLTNDPDFTPLNIAVVFSPPADVSSDVKQIQEDLPQEWH